MRHAPTSRTSADRRLARRGLICGAALAVCLSVLVPAAAARAEPGTKARVAFVGDSLVQNYYMGVRRLVGADACLKSNLDLSNHGHPATGLSRSDHFNWQQEVRTIGQSYRPTLMVISVGMNDRQGIIDPKGVITQRGAKGWDDAYRQQIADFLRGAMASKAIILFVGLPVMRERGFNNDMQANNRLYAEAVAKVAAPNVRYVEPWRLNPTGPDVYAARGPGKDGKVVQLRNADGMHPATGGEDLIAQYLLPKIVAALTEAGMAVDKCPETKAAQ
jgi:hypothetical protein